MNGALSEADVASLRAQESVDRFLGMLNLTEGFAFYLLLTPSPEVTAAVLSIARAAHPEGWQLVVLDPYVLRVDVASPPDEQELVDLLLLPLTSRRAKGERRPDAVLLDLSCVSTRDDETVGRFFLRMNRARETLRQRLARPIVLAIPARLAPVFANAAPDLRSGATTFAVAPPPRSLDDRTRRALEHMPELVPYDVLELFPREEATHIARVGTERVVVRLDGLPLDTWIQRATQEHSFDGLAVAAVAAVQRTPHVFDTLVGALRDAALDRVPTDVPSAIALHRVAAKVLATPRDRSAPSHDALHEAALHLNRAGDLLHALGRIDEALPLFREAYELRLRLFDARPETRTFRELARSAHRVARATVGRGATAEAVVVLDEVLRRLRRWKPDEIPVATRHDAVLLMLRAGLLRLHAGDVDDARPLLGDAHLNAALTMQGAPHVEEYRCDYGLACIAMAVLAALDGGDARASELWWTAQVEIEAARERRPGDAWAERLARVCAGDAGRIGEGLRGRAA